MSKMFMNSNREKKLPNTEFLVSKGMFKFLFKLSNKEKLSNKLTSFFKFKKQFFFMFLV